MSTFGSESVASFGSESLASPLQRSLKPSVTEVGGATRTNERTNELTKKNSDSDESCGNATRAGGLKTSHQISMKTDSASPTHVPVVEDVGDGWWRTRCSCGHATRRIRTEQQAYLAGIRHAGREARLAEPQGPKVCTECGELVRWAAVAGYEGVYEVSDHGHVRSIAKRKGARFGRLLIYCEDGKGYPRVHLTTGNVHKKVRVHRLVCTAFVGPAPSPDHQVNHIDRNKRNAHWANLEWVTAVENVRHSNSFGDTKRRTGVDHPSAVLDADKVKLIRESGLPHREIARLMGVSHATIQNIRARRTWRHVA